ncbi:MAG: hypothetical protein OXI51_09255 [Chloroflexota bacterium]|nr:hypothetical protein [Chloroflexota bacterium]
MTVPTINFRSIREHEGTKHRGFEELVFQLIPWIDEEVAGREVVRHGSPDGGVEAHVKFRDGSIRGWQAKYFFSIGASQLKQMKESFHAALEAYPTLSSYTFVVPFNPPSGKPKRGKSARQRVDDAFARWESEAAKKGHMLKFGLVGESRLLDLLTAEEHAGRVHYWFDARALFGRDWQLKSIEAAIDAAGPRYTREVSVDLPVSFVFEGLGRTERFANRLSEHVAEVALATRRLSVNRESALTNELAAEVVSAAATVENLVAALEEAPLEGVTPLDWDQQSMGLRDAWERLDTLHMELFRREEVLRSEKPDGAATSRDSPWEGVQTLRLGVLDVSHALDNLIEFLSSPAARLAATPLLFLTGDAGTGKTHLLCDVAERRVKEGLPTVLVMGQQIGEGNPRALVPDQLGLKDMSMEAFLSALNAAGEVAGTRALFMVDAINEGGGLVSWPPHLRSLSAEVTRYPYVGLVLSCRSSYVEAMLDSASEASEPRPADIGFVEVKHRGFAGNEWKAATTFFEHYRLALPDFPLLVPEYTNPLFLKLLCQSLHSAGEKTLPRGAIGVTRLFERFLGEANRTLARRSRCDFRRKDDLVSRAVASVAGTMLATGQDWIPMAEFRRISQELLPRPDWDKSLEKGLIDEGVVIEDMLGSSAVARLSYQRLGDHLQAVDLLRARDIEGIRSFLVKLDGEEGGLWERSGLLEALAVELPEKLGRELHELVANPGDWDVQDAFLESVIWRDPACFPDDLALPYLKSISRSRSDWYDDPVLDKLLQVACVPGHPFNAERLDKTLAQLRLPVRDAHWTTYINSCAGKDSIVRRIVNWARSPRQEAVADDAASLAAVTLAWLLASSNRGLRDCATKALVTLLRGRIPTLVDLLERFDSVDDPYVTERLYAVAYACALSTTAPETLRVLAGAVYDNVFADGQPPVHIMLRDYARGVIEVALSRGVVPPQVDLNLVRPPYSSPWPVRIPSRESLQDRAPEPTHRQLWMSLDGPFADFANYTVGHAVSQFEAPNQGKLRRQRREMARRTEDTAPSAPTTDESEDSPLHAFLDQLQRHPPPDPSLEPVMWSGSEAARWILGRVLKLGWNPARLGAYDNGVASQDRHAEDDRIERIGKKYQWIAFHELLARIADHCKFKQLYSDPLGPYDGPRQLLERDIDPTLTSTPLNKSSRHSAVTWWQPLSVDIERFENSDARSVWSLREDDLPQPDDLRALLQVTDPDGSAWLALNGMYNWEEEPPKDAPAMFVARGQLWLMVRSYVVPRRSFDAFTDWAQRQDWYGAWMPDGQSTDGAYLGEWGRHPPSQDVGDGLRKIADRRYQSGEAPTDVLPTWATYHWEGDGSITGGMNKVVPASWLVSHADLQPSTGNFAFVGREGQEIAFDPSARESGPSALLFREDSFRTLLDREDCSLVWTVLGEKNVLGGDFRPRPILAISGVAGLESGSADLEVALRTVVHQPGAEPLPPPQPQG